MQNHQRCDVRSVYAANGDASTYLPTFSGTSKLQQSVVHVYVI
jgi:hypothetical protein